MRGIILKKRLAAAFLAALALASCATTARNRGQAAWTQDPRVQESPSDYQAAIAKAVVYDYSLELFTAFALANVAGYNDENHGAFSPVRQGLRADLDSLRGMYAFPPALVNPAARGFGTANYAVHSGAAPDFLSDLTENPGAASFASSMARLYGEGKIPELYEKYRPAYEREIEAYRSAVGRPIAELVAFLGMPSAEIQPIRVMPNLLDAYWRGYCVTWKGRINIVTGPTTAGPNVVNILHEFSHFYVNPTLDRSSAVAPLARKLESKYGPPWTKGYDTWKNVIAESFVRALSYVPEELHAQAPARMRQETSEGFILTDYIYARLMRDFPSYEGSFAAFCDQVMKDYLATLG